MAFNRCVITNEGKLRGNQEVLATSATFSVEFNYEFLEDFQDNTSTDR